MSSFRLSPSPSYSFRPEKYLGAGWTGHVPFAYDVIAELKPAVVVELGSHRGESYFTFCEAVRNTGAPTRLHAVDTWQGDKHAGFYGNDVYEKFKRHNDAHFGKFSTLHRMTFDQALELFEDESIDVLHIDGLHTYDAVKHDYETWLPKVRKGGLILFHDIVVRQGDFGVWKFWSEISPRWPSMDFHQSSGLGVIQKSEQVTGGGEFLKTLFSKDPDVRQEVRNYYEMVARKIWLEYQVAASSLKKKAIGLLKAAPITGTVLRRLRS